MMKFTLPSFSELGRIREWLCISPETAKSNVPQLEGAESSPYSEAVRSTYALYLCRKLADNIAGKTATQALPVLAQSAPSQTVPSMKDLANMRVDLRLRIDEAALRMGIGASTLSCMERGDIAASLNERKKYWELLQKCKRGEITYTRSTRQKYRHEQPGGQLTFKP